MLTIENAKNLKEDFEYLIGEDYRDAQIDSIIILPNNDSEFKEGLAAYVKSGNSNLILKSSSNGYIVIVIMDLNLYYSSGILFQAELTSIIEEKNIEIDYSKYGIAS